MRRGPARPLPIDVDDLSPPAILDSSYRSSPRHCHFQTRLSVALREKDSTRGLCRVEEEVSGELRLEAGNRTEEHSFHKSVASLGNSSASSLPS